MLIDPQAELHPDPVAELFAECFPAGRNRSQPDIESLN
jgi:hypothetical protein